MRIPLPARRYVGAVIAVRRAIRLWHRIDDALSTMPKKGPEWQRVFDAHHALDCALHDAKDRLVGRAPPREEP